MRILVSVSLFFLLVQTGFSEQDVRYYDIELVVFENLEGPIDNNEIWPAAKQLEIPENAAILGRKYEGKLPAKYDPKLLFNRLSVNDYHLNKEAEELKASGQYRLLLHTGWRQPGLPKKAAVSVYFKHAIAEDYGSPEAIDESAINASSAVTETLPAPLPPVTGAIAHLEGAITIALSRYLHLDVEMLYKRDPTADEVDMYDSSFLEDRRDKEKVFYLNQKRRMRSKETHYIDNPVFSMLVRITPYETNSSTARANKTNSGR